MRKKKGDKKIFMNQTVKKSKIELPFSEAPKSTVFYYTAFLLGILQSSVPAEELDRYLCGKYINCCTQITPGKQKLHISIDEDKFGVEEGILSRQSLEMKPETYADLGASFFDFIKQMLSLGYYVYGYCNEEYIPGKSAFGKYYFLHDYILIGYDDDGKYFSSVGYLGDGKFQKYGISYRDFQAAMRSVRDVVWRLHFYKLKENVELPDSLPEIRSELRDYLASTSNRCKMDKDCIYGISAIRAMQSIAVHSMREGELDLRLTRACMEHKFLTHHRIAYLHRQGIRPLGRFAEDALNVYRLAQRVHFLGIKFLMTKEAGICASLKDDLDRIIEKEAEYLPRVIEEL